MGKNKGKGGKHRRRGASEGDGRRELQFKEDGQEYAKVTKILGHCRMMVYCFDGVKRMAHIRGKMRKKEWVQNGDIVLVGLREFQDDKADILVKYSVDEARNLRLYGELPETARLGSGGGGAEDPASGDEAGALDDELFEFDDIDDI